MKSRIIRLCLSLAGGWLLTVAVFLWGAREADPVKAFAPPNVDRAIPNTFVHQWDVNELFSCADSSIQFVELHNPTTDNFETQFNGQVLVATNLAGTLSHTFTFTANVSSPTGNKSLLVATAGFSSLPGGITPDFTLPDNFLFTDGGSVKFATFDTFSYGAAQLPLDGVNSLSKGGVTGVNSPINYAGDTGSVLCLQAPDLTLSKTADAPGIVEAGIVMTYTIRAENQGAAAATNALITDTVPLSVTYVPNSASDGGVFGSGVISWANLTINQGVPLTRTFQVTVGSTITTGDKITNTAYITSAEGASAVASAVVTGGSLTSQKIYLPLILKN